MRHHSFGCCLRCSLGGACLTRFLALGEIPVRCAIIDGGITPYQFCYPLRKLVLARDILSFKIAANSRKVLELAFPPERFTLPGQDPVKEYSPTWIDGKKHTRNIYAHTREECEEKLKVLIAEMKAELAELKRQKADNH